MQDMHGVHITLFKWVLVQIIKFGQPKRIEPVSPYMQTLIVVLNENEFPTVVPDGQNITVIIQ